VEECTKYYVGQKADKNEKTNKRKSVESLCFTSVCVGVRYTGTEREPGQVIVSRNHRVRRIYRVKRKDRRKMKKLRENIGMKKKYTEESS